MFIMNMIFSLFMETIFLVYEVSKDVELWESCRQTGTVCHPILYCSTDYNWHVGKLII